jgi:hypothetical protein
MDPNLLKIIEIVATAIVTMGGYFGGRAVINKVRNSNTPGSGSTVNQDTCELKHRSLDDKLAIIHEDISDIKQALTVLIRVDTKLEGLDDKIDNRVYKAVSEHVSEYHPTHVTGKLPKITL